MREILKTALVLLTLLGVSGCANQGDRMNSSIEKELAKNLHMTCVTESESHPALDPQADEWFKKARRIQKGEETGTQEEVIKLYEQAIERKHWKAYTNLASIYLNGDGVKRDTSKGIKILEAGMKLNYARCYAMMAKCLASGRGVRADEKASWVYRRRAAELGDSGAQFAVGEKIFSLGYIAEGVDMMKCADKQDDFIAAHELGYYYSIGTSATPFDQQKALYYFQRATRLGYYKAASYLRYAFDGGEMKLEKDHERANRYRTVMRFIEHYNRQDIYPVITNLDAIVPLPPAPLPKWDGKIEIEK
ncbi:MAG: DUF6396 domain-containing protein [Sulfuricurvum sp.]|nr:DUF6396 domain-containing protein [Sulfuricurvum sp.]